MPTLTITKTYADEQVLTETDLDNIKSSIETFINITLLGADNLQTGSVGTDQLASTSVTTAKIANAAVTAAKLSSSPSDDTLRAVTTNAIQDASVTNAKIAANAIDFSLLIAAVQQSLCPSGSILTYGGVNFPSGWLNCDGSAISRTTFSDLFTAIGTAFGSGDGTTTFNIPDFRGRFLRGLNGGAGRDPGASSRTAMASGGNVGDNIGTVQDSGVVQHTHTIGAKSPTTAIVGTTSVLSGISTSSGSNTAIGDNSGGSSIATLTIPTVTGTTGTDTETRPLNAAVNYIIKT